MSSKKRDLVGNYEVTKEGIVTRREVLMMGAMAAATGGLLATQGQAAVAADAAAAPAGAYKARDFKSLAGTMDGLSADQINQHLKLYEGYIAKANAIHKDLKSVDLSTANATYSAVRELLIEQSFAHNGVVYHEYYFNNLGGKGGEPTGNFKSAIEEQWGSNAKFIDFLKAAGKSARGWVIVGYNTRAGYVDAYALDTHNIASPANIVPLVVLDVYEHAYMIDYKTDRAKYLEAFINNMNWDVVEKRLNVATKHPSGADSTL